MEFFLERARSLNHPLGPMSSLSGPASEHGKYITMMRKRVCWLARPVVSGVMKKRLALYEPPQKSQ